MTLNPPTRSPGRGRTYGAKMIGWEGRFYKEVAPLELQNRVSAGINSSRFGEHLTSWGFSGRQDGARALPLGGQVARPNGRVARSTCPPKRASRPFHLPAQTGESPVPPARPNGRVAGSTSPRRRASRPFHADLPGRSTCLPRQVILRGRSRRRGCRWGWRAGGWRGNAS